jgi:7-carboxy-7-deazaguanine synthase
MHDPEINITELFASVQGETSFTGLPTTFIRLSACNLRCRWCDTPYSFGRGTPWSISKLFAAVEQHGCRNVCVTGGEPLLQPEVHSLISQLADANYIVCLETGGSLPIDQVDARTHIILDIKCPGSSMEHKNHWSNLDIIRTKDEVKFVLADAKDYDYAKMICEKYRIPRKTPHILFSPVFGELDPQELVAWILRDRFPARLNLQIHKYIWEPTTQGV